MKNQFKVIVAVKSIRGTSFVGVRNQRSQKTNELSNQTFVVGADYGNILANDLKKLQNFDLACMSHHPQAEVIKAYGEMVESHVKRLSDDKTKAELLAAGDKTIKASVAQTDAYEPIGNGLKIHKETNNLYLYGLCVKKTVLEKGEYKEVKSALKTIIKNEITKKANLSAGKFREVIVGNVKEIQIQGITID